MPSACRSPFTRCPSGMLREVNTHTIRPSGGSSRDIVLRKIPNVPRLFGTDGVRGLAGEEVTAELAFRLGRSAVVALTERGERRPHIVVGRDTRASGELLEAA